MRAKKIKVIFAALFICFNAINIYADEAAVFNANKDNLLKCSEFLKKFAKLRDNNEVVAQVNEALVVIDMADKTLSNIKKGIKGRPGNYERRNPEAKKIKFGYITSFMQGNLRRSKSKIKRLKGSLLSSVKTRVLWLEKIHPENLHRAAVWKDEINHYFKVLDTIAKNDPKVKKAKKEYRPRIKSAYAKAMKLVKDSRMPKGVYRKGDKKSLEKLLAATYKKHSGKIVIRTVITNPDWIKRFVIEVRNGKIYLGLFYYMSAHCAIKKGKSIMVYVVNFRKLKTSAGFKPLEVSGVGSGYPVLPENINK